MTKRLANTIYHEFISECDLGGNRRGYDIYRERERWQDYHAPYERGWWSDSRSGL